MLCPCQTAQGGHSSLLTIIWCMNRGGNAVSMPDSSGWALKPADDSLVYAQGWQCCVHARQDLSRGRAPT